MSRFARSPITAVLGPTNTGKTHLAVERMCAHSSGMMGFPLRLLAREVYDRLVGIKGADQVALLTGEEKILPAKARWFCCTAESMPLSGVADHGDENGLRDFAFVGIDEAQLGADPERGHVFTDRILRARGREETMILGSASLAPLIRALVPEAEIIDRPRFSTLRYAGAKKLSRLPPRSVIVAFSAEEVYAVAEMLRRFRGGAAVVMGALSPRTRNAQVAMFQSGEVDYLVATDAVGMGLNMDVSHVAFAALTKFDGYRTRRLTVSEMAQIAGRAGRHQRDGTFGSMGAESGPAAFTPEEIERIETHHFPPLTRLFWRDGVPDTTSVTALIASLEQRPDRPELVAAPEAVDLAVLKRLADEPDIGDRAKNPAMVARLWAACGLPDFQKLGADHHARTVGRIWRYLSEGDGYIPRDWFAQNVARLDTVQGDIALLSQRIAMARTWSYIAHRADWLAEPREMAERTSALEERLSDALHAALTQRFVDRRTAVLLRDMGRNTADLPVDVADDGAVSVDGEPIGQLDGFQFKVDPDARATDRKLLLAAAERRMARILASRAEALLDAPDALFSLAGREDGQPALCWNGGAVATLQPGPMLLAPEIRLDRALLGLSPALQRRVAERLSAWMTAQLARHLTPLERMSAAARDPATPPHLRALHAQLADAGGIVDREQLDPALALLDKQQRHLLARSGIVVGALDIFHPALLKPGAAQWRMVLAAVRRGKPLHPLPPSGSVMVQGIAAKDAAGAKIAGFRRFGEQYLRIDMAERVIRQAHQAIEKKQPLTLADEALISLGLSEPAFLALMRAAGFRPVTPVAEGGTNWAFRGRPRRRQRDKARPGDAQQSGAGTKGVSDKAALKSRPAPSGRAGMREGRPTPHRQATAGKAFAGLAQLLGLDG